MNTITEHHFIDDREHDCYVSPHICRQLVEAGFNIETTFKWKIFQTAVVLDIFRMHDPDEYYLSMEKFEKLNPPQYIFPAFTIKDCEKFLPDLLLTVEGGVYKASLVSIYKEVGEAISTRMPDAYAQLLLQALKKRNVIDINKIMQKHGKLNSVKSK